MKLYTRARVVKSDAVEVSIPCLVDCQKEEFQFLGHHLAVVHDRNESSVSGEEFVGAEGEERWQPQTRAPKESESSGSQLIQQAKSDAQAMMAEAEKIRAQAEAALQEAQEKALIIQERARTEAEAAIQKLREEVSQQAYQEGYTQGLEQGLQEGKAQGQQEVNRLKSEAQGMLKLAQRAAQEEWSKVDELMLRLALKVAERILRVHILEHPEQLLQRIRALSLLPEEREGWKLHVSTADYTWLSQCPAEDINIPLLEDQTLSAGDCFLECTEGIFDARVEAQLERCEQLLREELRHERLA